MGVVSVALGVTASAYIPCNREGTEYYSTGVPSRRSCRLQQDALTAGAYSLMRPNGRVAGVGTGHLDNGNAMHIWQKMMADYKCAGRR
jgi:hypothetical protein